MSPARPLPRVPLPDGRPAALRRVTKKSPKSALFPCCGLRRAANGRFPSPGRFTIAAARRPASSAVSGPAPSAAARPCAAAGSGSRPFRRAELAGPSTRRPADEHPPARRHSIRNHARQDAPGARRIARSGLNASGGPVCGSTQVACAGSKTTQWSALDVAPRVCPARCNVTGSRLMKQSSHGPGGRRCRGLQAGKADAAFPHAAAHTRTAPTTTRRTT